ncbi:dihydrofolate reductase, partial [Phenoliferia sp. Uapishka_3]
MAPISLTLIVAATSSNGIGVSASLPWRLSKEMAYFAKVTKAFTEGSMNAVIMGRKSWESIPPKYRPLAGRVNVVVSRQSTYDVSQSPHTHLTDSLPSAISLLTSLPTPTINRTFLIGGAELYTHSLTHAPYLEASSPLSADRILLTRIKTPFECDVNIPEIRPENDKNLSGWKRASHEDLVEWVGFEVPEGDQTEKDLNSPERREVTYEFQMWVRK